MISEFDHPEPHTYKWSQQEIQWIEQKIAAAIAAEREACADICLSIANEDAGNPYKQALRLAADSIRARGEK